MANFNMNTMTNFSHLRGSATKIPILIPKYYQQWADRMEDYLNGIDEDLMRSIKRGPFSQYMLVTVGTSATSEDVIIRRSKMQENGKKCMREVHGMKSSRCQPLQHFPSQPETNLFS